MKKQIIILGSAVLLIVILLIGVFINESKNQDKPVSEFPIVGGNNDVVESTPVVSDPVDEPTPSNSPAIEVEDTTPQNDPDALPIGPDEMDNPEAEPTDKNDSEGNSEPQDTSEQEYVKNNAGLPTEDKIEDVEIQEDTFVNPTPENTQELTEEQQEALDIWQDYLDSLESQVTPTPSTPAEEPETPEQTERTEAEVQAAIDEFVESFSDLSKVDTTWFTENAIEYLDKNLDIIQNHPEKSTNVSTAIRKYKIGSFTDEDLIDFLTAWLEGGGLYGDKEITVQ